MSRVASIVVRSALLSLTCFSAFGATSARASTDVGSINFTLGYKNLASEWSLDQPQYDAADNLLPADRAYQPALGIEGTWGHKLWPVHIAFDVLNSADDGLWHIPRDFDNEPYDVRVRAHTLELGLGVRRAFNMKLVTPYAGAGGLWARGKAELEFSDPASGQFGAPFAHAHTHSSGFGFWIGGGAYRRLGPRFQMGVAYRFSKATLPAKAFTVDSGTVPPNASISFPKADGGGRTIQLVVGWSFPSP